MIQERRWKEGSLLPLKTAQAGSVWVQPEFWDIWGVRMEFGGECIIRQTQEERARAQAGREEHAWGSEGAVVPGQ